MNSGSRYTLLSSPLSSLELHGRNFLLQDILQEQALTSDVGVVGRGPCIRPPHEAVQRAPREIHMYELSLKAD